MTHLARIRNDLYVYVTKEGRVEPTAPRYPKRYRPWLNLFRKLDEDVNVYEHKEDLSVYYHIKDQFTDASYAVIEDSYPETYVTIPTIAVDAGTIRP